MSNTKYPQARCHNQTLTTSGLTSPPTKEPKDVRCRAEKEKRNLQKYEQDHVGFVISESNYFSMPTVPRFLAGSQWYGRRMSDPKGTVNIPFSSFDPPYNHSVAQYQIEPPGEKPVLKEEAVVLLQLRPHKVFHLYESVEQGESWGMLAPRRNSEAITHQKTLMDTRAGIEKIGADDDVGENNTYDSTNYRTQLVNGPGT
ncbi:unnamed protein product [Soboliphyme baturini]|uniref:Uncharacterized protein n=1 Tax=Soboliphyme baturini TaxID=241478 RepID=A0A183IBV5_9BILA|nr:unnamed protein product [Soboliphyme baturini]